MKLERASPKILAAESVVAEDFSSPLQHVSRVGVNDVVKRRSVRATASSAFIAILGEEQSKESARRQKRGRG